MNFKRNLKKIDLKLFSAIILTLYSLGILRLTSNISEVNLFGLSNLGLTSHMKQNTRVPVKTFAKKYTAIYV